MFKIYIYKTVFAADTITLGRVLQCDNSKTVLEMNKITIKNNMNATISNTIEMQFKRPSLPLPIMRQQCGNNAAIVRQQCGNIIVRQ